MIPVETPYKVLKYLVTLFEKRSIPKNNKKERLIVYLYERKLIIGDEESPINYKKTKKFDKYYSEEIFPLFQKYDSFIQLHQIENLETYYSIGDLDNLILIDKDQPRNLTLQEILATYFNSSKHTQTNSNLSNAIKTILKIDEFAEDNKDLQFISILYPKNKTRFIILCENKNRLRSPRHNFIEFWYAGGRNTNQLQFIPKPNSPIFYLCDWDFDGINIYTHIKQKYFPNLTVIIPINYQSLMVKQEEVKNHHSKWKNNKFLIHLNEKEKALAEILIMNDSIIEEQKIFLAAENLFQNLIC